MQSENKIHPRIDKVANDTNSEPHRKKIDEEVQETKLNRRYTKTKTQNLIIKLC